MRTLRESGWTRSLLVGAVGAGSALFVRMLWRALHAPADVAVEQSVMIATAVSAGTFIGDSLRPVPRLRWPARAVYTAIGCLIAAWMVGALTK